MAHFTTITVNDHAIWAPNEMEMKREAVYAGEYTTCTGKVIADQIGWRSSDMNLQWDSLPEVMLNLLLDGYGSQGTITFLDADGEHTEAFIPISYANSRTRFTGPDGRPMWDNVQMEVRFLNVHN